jgi:hypothetical protein
MRKKRVVHKPLSEMTVVERIKDAEAAISRLEGQIDLNRRGNYNHEMSVNLYAALQRWQKTLAILQGENK